MRVAERAPIIGITLRNHDIGLRKEGSYVVWHLPQRQGRGPEGMGMDL